MARTGRPRADLVLSDEEREQLARWAMRCTSSQTLALRSRIVLECATGDSNTAVAQRLGVSRPTVGKWRSRLVVHRLDGLADEPRPGRPATVTAEQGEDVVMATLESAPPNATHWSRRHEELLRRHDALTVEWFDLEDKAQEICPSSTMWLALAPVPFSDSDAALSWCEGNGYDADNCAARVVPATPASDTDIAFGWPGRDPEAEGSPHILRRDCSRQAPAASLEFC